MSRASISVTVTLILMFPPMILAIMLGLSERGLNANDHNRRIVLAVDLATLSMN